MQPTHREQVTHSPEDLTIIADHRENRSGIPELLKQDGLFDVAITNLGSGDYLVADLAIERKTIPDLISSLNDGRLFQQLFTLKRSYRRRLLIVEGESLSGKMPAHKADGLITKITAGLQVPILQSRTTGHTAVLIKRIALQLFKLTASTPVIREARTQQELSFQQRYVLLGLPGVGITRANLLLAHFGSLAAVFNASVEQLAATPGIGRKYADRIRELLESKAQLSTEIRSNERENFKSPSS